MKGVLLKRRKRERTLQTIWLIVGAIGFLIGVIVGLSDANIGGDIAFGVIVDIGGAIIFGVIGFVVTYIIASLVICPKKWKIALKITGIVGFLYLAYVLWGILY